MQHRRRGAFAAIVALLAAVGFLAAGCGNSQVSLYDAKRPASPATSAAGETGAAKPTPEQEAAKQQGEKQGEELQAVQAAERSGQ